MQITGKIDREFCKMFHLLPVLDNNSKLTVLVSDKSDFGALSFIKFHFKSHPILKQVTDNELSTLIESTIPSDNGTSKIDQSSSENDSSNSTEIVQEIERLFRKSIQAGASDIHFEPFENELVCRRRIDGSLIKIAEFDKDKAANILSRIKILAGLDIAERRRPQDGRIRFEIDGRYVDIRVSTIPTDFGEKAVLRILDKQQLRLDLGSIGFSDNQFSLFKEKISLPNGIVIVTGPTGSGKTTTLYAALNHIKSPSLNISTVEDPIEYNLEGINQTQVKPDIGVTFATMLRALLRQDPNVIMIGEIRDPETLEIAMRASLTGHLVISTLHTNNSIASIARLLDMGAEPSLLASCLRLIVAQRLVRKVCPECSTTGWDEAQKSAAVRLGINDHTSKPTMGLGCTNCVQTGYKGRAAIFEMLDIDQPIREAISSGVSETELEKVTKAIGFTSLREHGSQLVISGQTTPVEIVKETI